MYFLIFLALTSSKSLKISILYEKSMPEKINNFYSNYLENLITKYNQIFIEEQIRIQLSDIIPFNEYVNIPEYSELVNLAGTDNLRDRASELRKINKNHIMLGVSTVTDDSDGNEYNYYSPCNSIYIFNLNSSYNQDKELTKILSNSLINLLSKIFIMEIPDFTQEIDEEDIKFFRERLRRSEIVKNFNDCFVEKEELDTKSDFSKIEEFTKLYDELKNKTKLENNPDKRNDSLEETIKQLSSKVSTLFDIVNVNKQGYNNFNKNSSNANWPLALMNRNLGNKSENKEEVKENEFNSKLDYGFKKRVNR